ncbi:hypothetical protein EZS27_000251 [termite gut metagenome]|uniref:F5/8 type C domain-containing protein n=1 Tax=termite gut metagenome TaxID=433724 RepID=A0A5J4T3N3_9ZZZZ
MINKRTVFSIIICLLFSLCQAQFVLVKDNKAKSRIVVNMSDSIDMEAALLLQNFSEKVTGVKLSVIAKDSEIKQGDILIGNFQLPVNGLDVSKISEDGFFLSSDDSYIRIVKGTGKGSIYAVVTLLEDYFGIHYYAENAYSLQKSSSMIVPSGIRRIDNPSFQYRQTQSYSLKDPYYRLWHRLETPTEIFANNLWVHTFNRILPASEFGEKHPEYYSYINGKRRPGAVSQWCLTNPEVFELVVHRLDSIFKENPGKDMISVSQNDTQTHCFCDSCRAIDEYEESPSGTIIRFLNKLAKRFPDKNFSTLAYLYSVKPPKYTKPLPNVNIMLCDIGCYREVPLTENLSGQEFMRNLEGWSAISNTIFLWDYGINFDNYVSPFPNFHIIQPNMKLFYEHNVNMHFSQIGGPRGTDFAELRSYLVAKLLWNVSADVDSLIQSFLNGYYGKAASYLYQYLKLREDALLKSKIPLWIYDTPITHKTGMLNESLMESYKDLFDCAELAVKDDSLLLSRVRIARLPVMYAELEIDRTNLLSNITDQNNKLNLFRRRSRELNVGILNEKDNTIEDYCDLYIQRYISRDDKNLAYGSSVNYLVPPDPPYDKIANTALTDGLYGGSSFNESWVGWIGKNTEFVVDLGKIEDVHRIVIDFLHNLGAWILLPKNITCYVSKDSNNFIAVGYKEIAEDREAQIKFATIPIELANSMEVRYIKIKIEGIGLCPSWHYGVGNPAWFFLDEIKVY